MATNRSLTKIGSDICPAKRTVQPYFAATSGSACTSSLLICLSTLFTVLKESCKRFLVLDFKGKLPSHLENPCGVDVDKGNLPSTFWDSVGTWVIRPWMESGTAVECDSFEGSALNLAAAVWSPFGGSTLALAAAVLSVGLWDLRAGAGVGSLSFSSWWGSGNGACLDWSLPMVTWASSNWRRKSNISDSTSLLVCRGARMCWAKRSMRLAFSALVMLGPTVWPDVFATWGSSVNVYAFLVSTRTDSLMFRVRTAVNHPWPK